MLILVWLAGVLVDRVKRAWRVVEGGMGPKTLYPFYFRLPPFTRSYGFFYDNRKPETFTVFGPPASHKIRVIPKNYFLAKSARFKTVEIISPTNIAFIQPRITLMINRYTAYKANAHHKTVPRPWLRPAIFLSCDKKFTFPCGKSEFGWSKFPTRPGLLRRKLSRSG